MRSEAPDEVFAALLDDDPERLYERAPCGYLSTTADGTIVKVNETFLDLTGFRRSELVGRRSFAELLSPGGRIYHETHYAPMLRMQGRVREIALDVVCADGRRLPVLVNSIAETDAAGNTTIIRTAIFDATERREYERELLRAKRSAEASEARASALARTLQQTLVPPLSPQIPGLDVAAVYRPAGSGDEVGGDFYDVFELAPDDWGVVIGDVCGKGVDAAIVTSLARYAVRAMAVREPSPARVLTDVDDVLRQSPGSRLCTVALARLRRRNGAWHVVLALGGHPLAVLIDGSQPQFVGRPGTLLGVVAAGTRTDAHIDLPPGYTLVLYTDGVTEARAGDEFYGDQRLLAVLRRGGSDAREIADAVVADALAFQSGVPRDDIAVVVLRVPAVARAR